MEKSQKSSSQIYTSSSQSTSANIFVNNDYQNNNNNKFANVLTIGTNEDFDFPPPPPPPIGNSPGNEAEFSPDQLPSPPRFHANLRNFSANSSHYPANSVHCRSNSSHIHATSAAHNDNSPRNNHANLQQLASPSFYHSYSKSTPSPHRHSSLNFATQRNTIAAATAAADNNCSSRNIGRCQLFDEMDERILRSRRAKHDNLQQLDCTDEHLACKISPNRTFNRYNENNPSYCRTFSVQEPSSSNYFTSRDGLKSTSGGIFHSKSIKPGQDTRLTTSDLEDSSHSDQFSRDGEYLIKLGMNPIIEKLHSGNCESKNCCGRPSESEDSALPESSSSMSPTSSSASSSSISGRLKWAAEERNKENFGNISSHYSATSARKSHLTPFGDHHLNSNAISARNPKGMCSQEGGQNNKMKFGYGRWVQNANGKWQRVDALSADASSEMPRAHSADRFATMHAKTPLNYQKFTPLRQLSESFSKLSAEPPTSNRASSNHPLHASSTMALNGGKGAEFPYHQRNQSVDTFWRRSNYAENVDVSPIWQKRDPHADATSLKNVNKIVKELEGEGALPDRSVKCHNTVPQNYYTNNLQNYDESLSRDMSTGLTIDAELWRSAPQNYSTTKLSHESGYNKPIIVLNASTAVVTTLKTTSVSTVPQNRLNYGDYSEKIYETELDTVENKNSHSRDELSAHPKSNIDTQAHYDESFEGGKIWQKAVQGKSKVERLLSSDKEASATTTNSSTTPAESVRAEEECDEDDSDRNSSGVTPEQIEEIRNCLSASELAKYTFFTVCLKRSRGVEDGSVGLILTSAIPDFGKGANNDEFITIQRVITGSIADYDNRLLKGDRVFFIQHKSTQNMSAPEARKLLKSPAPTVHLVVGRLTAVNNATFLKNASNSLCLGEKISSGSNYSDIFTSDPARECYDTDPTAVVLQKSELGVGFSLDGGLGSKFGDRPIIVKKVFAAGSAAKSGSISVGDEVRTIDGYPLVGKTQLEAWKILNSRPEGPVTFEIYKRIVPSAL